MKDNPTFPKLQGDVEISQGESGIWKHGALRSQTALTALILSTNRNHKTKHTRLDGYECLTKKHFWRLIREEAPTTGKTRR